MADEDKYSYKDSTQQIEEKIWSQIDAYEIKKSDLNNLINIIDTELAKIKNPHKKDSIYIDVLKYLAPELSVDLILKVYSKIVDDKKIVEPLRNILKKENKNSDFDKNVLLNYVSSRIDKIKDLPTKSKLLIELSGAMEGVDSYHSVSVLDKNRQILNENNEEDWSIDNLLKVAEGYSSIGNKGKAISVLNKLRPQVLKIKNITKKDSLLDSLCIAYIKNEENDAALALTNELSPSSQSLILRTLAQQLLHKDDYHSAQKFISVINDPYQHFLALESWLSKASYDEDFIHIQQVVIEMTELVESLSKPVHKFEVYMILSKANYDLKDTRTAKRHLKTARSLISLLPENFREDSEQSLEMLNSVLDL